MYHSRRPRPRFTGQGRPVFHKHGSRRALVEEAIDDREAIAEQVETYEDPTGELEDWERELLACSTSSGYHVPRPVARTAPALFARPVGGFDKERLERQEEERRREEREGHWVLSASQRADSASATRALRALLTTNEPARVRPFVSSTNKVRIFDLARSLGLTAVQTLYVVNGTFNEYAKASSSTIASIVAVEIIDWSRTDAGRQTIAEIKGEA